MSAENTLNEPVSGVFTFTEPLKPKSFLFRGTVVWIWASILVMGIALMTAASVKGFQEGEIRSGITGAIIASVLTLSLLWLFYENHTEHFKKYNRDVQIDTYIRERKKLDEHFSEVVLYTESNRPSRLESNIFTDSFDAQDSAFNHVLSNAVSHWMWDNTLLREKNKKPIFTKTYSNRLYVWDEDRIDLHASKLFFDIDVKITDGISYEVTVHPPVEFVSNSHKVDELKVP